MESNEEKVITCFHCGNQTLMKEVDKYIHKETDDIYDDEGNTINQYYYQKTWRLYFCPVCKNVTLFSEEFDNVEVDFKGETEVTTKQLYPYESVEMRNIPSTVANAYESALKVREIDGAICAIAIRRTLEMMCKDKGEEGKNLYSMLKSLSDKGILPPILNDMASVLREIGNAAAHADEKKINKDLVPSMIEFTKIILDYVYNLPKQIEKIQARIGKIEMKASFHEHAKLKAEAIVIKNKQVD